MATNITSVHKKLFVGTGAPADGDLLTNNDSLHALGSIYVDKETGILYVRKGVTKVAATDWQYSAGGEGGGVEGVTGSLVDNTDPANPVVALPYKVYSALITQTDNDAPVATVFQNTLNVGSWSRSQNGVYTATITGTVNAAKVFIPGAFVRNLNSTDLITLPVACYDLISPNTVLFLYSINVYDYEDGTGVIELKTFDVSGTAGELSNYGSTGTTGRICLPEIRLYP